MAEVIDGDAFRGSPRSIRFLKYVVERAMKGDFDALKERVIGVELFGRSGTWNTGEDAIVRVTASDVRKRLLQHYGKPGASSRFRLALPSGSYVPEITCTEEEPSAAASSIESSTNSLVKVTSSSEPVCEVPELQFSPSHLSRIHKFMPTLAGSVICLLLAVIGILSWNIYIRRPQPQFTQAAASFPWKTLFRTRGVTNIIASDPNIAEIQGFTGGQLSAADYANHHYFDGPNKLTPEQDRFCRIILRGDKATTSDMEIAANIAVLASLNGSRTTVRGARNVQIADLRTNDNFILLGSPRSNPWSQLFNEQLDFQFVFDKQFQSEYINNVHPRGNEPRSYHPTAMGWDTGQSYAVIALLPNPDQNGQVLLLAGATAEGTTAAGKIAANPMQLTPMLKRCGIDPAGPLRHFELLLRLNMIAGSSDDVGYAACHMLPSTDTTGQP
ncbi:MAG: hypothetical protein P4K83_12085 [Terracidiphilus sp.]|nr:hypothetical protein [Terracidiphilus sp.]